jgi:hypothetical protein
LLFSLKNRKISYQKAKDTQPEFALDKKWHFLTGARSPLWEKKCVGLV